jgi:hypothetical protein
MHSVAHSVLHEHAYACMGACTSYLRPFGLCMRGRLHVLGVLCTQRMAVHAAHAKDGCVCCICYGWLRRAVCVNVVTNKFAMRTNCMCMDLRTSM